MKLQSIAFAGFVALAGFSFFGQAAAQTPTKASAQAKPRSIVDIHKNKASLAGKKIRVEGNVIKANNGIRGFNFVHLQDGTGSPGSNTLIVRSKDTANLGDKVAVSGMVVVDRDFGSGYFYPLLIEEASIEPKK